ncbi:accessory gene regulator ArgB-like protein [Romboutsia lituseburensis]|uniref:Accessory gene regulator B n=1 Tax=Romboutsia lituseburensis DSM 797 TaxID=1121325 RepID=A0A1G9QFA7_9FIRM|nr:accessory gene regulator B family protein [Romboutsia lituseburensis]CEH35488.1 Accessory gene regulator B [Romboutsia lituseburensis]SDM09666.1 accessory gene regulator B [Romboutsia lituseburensis DSM 797]
MGIETVSKSISNKMGQRLNKSEEEVAVLNYGLFILIHTSIAIISTFVVGILTNTLIEIMIISIIAALLKRYSGGVHSSSPSRCLITGIIFSLFLAMVCKFGFYKVSNMNLGIILILGIMLSYFILYRKCPVPCANKPLKKESTRKKLRKNAFKLINIYTGIIIIFYLLNIYTGVVVFKTITVSILLGVLLQVFSLTKAAELTIGGFELIYNIFKI